ncbi:MAG: TRAP transporter small permease [Devosia sp.]
MTSRLASTGAWLRARAENLLAAMLAVMFSVFILQILFRYVLNLPIGWTNEVSVIMWLWMVLFGTAFVIRDHEEIRFDILYSAVNSRWRRVLVLTTSVSLVVLFTISLPAVIDYVTFMKVQKTAYLKIRFDWLYSIYAIFAVATIIRQFWLGCQAIWGKDSTAIDPTKAGSGV